MSRLLKITFVGLLLALIGFILPSAEEQVEACGGFFCTTTPIDQNAERIIFTVNGDGTITAIVGINYVGDAEDFSWVVPVPSPPELDVADQNIFLNLQSATTSQVIYPENYCAGLTKIPCCGGGGGEPLLGQIGPYDYAILGSDDPEELITWLRDNDYQVTADMEPIIADYVNAGMYFLAMRLSQDADVGDIQPIVMTYEAENPMIPIKLTAIAAVENMPIYVWIFGETQYVPQNFAHEVIDYSVVRQPHSVRNIGGSSFPIALSGPYFRQVAAFQEEYDGKVFVTDYAGMTQHLMEFVGERYDEISTTFAVRRSIEQDARLTELFVRFPYITRLYGQMSPEQMTLDPIFVPDADAPDISNVVDLRELVPPLDFWGCSSRTIFRDIDQTLVPDSTYFDEWRIDVAHPEGWIFTEVELHPPVLGFEPSGDLMRQDEDEPRIVWVLSPQVVSQETILDFFAGEETPPMFVIMDISPLDWSSDAYRDEFFGIDFWQQGDEIHRYLYNPDSYNRNHEPLPRLLSDYRLQPTDSDEHWLTDANTLVVAVLTSPEGIEANRDMFNQMMRSAVSYDYYLHPDLRHTLFLTGNSEFDIGHTYSMTQIPYPDGWVDQVLDNGDILIAPDSGVAADQPYVRLIPYESYLEFNDSYRGYQPSWRDIRTVEEWQPVLDFVDTDYGIALTIDEGNSILQFADETFTFKTDSRRGYLRFTHGYVVEFSAPLDGFEDHQAVLTLIENTMTSR